jgi:hypothetical protein
MIPSTILTVFSAFITFFSILLASFIVMSFEAVAKRPSAALPSSLGISEALHLDVFHQPLRNRFYDSFVICLGIILKTWLGS